ncbi:M4 family metallopeptidase [Streptomyces avidinii]|uniref:M4 family metallopeptidase n=1 Tax=Streptomyces TaxID=1883 RepID=UPI002E2A12A9|nr:M4 family metallopeptidase [Streptomyces sp. NBC_00273]WST43411.1 M4 family metallopeptidase [Streptomyces avidinii]WTA95530.1 M4 family metallopeptidase [Streptomyces avidinii]
MSTAAVAATLGTTGVAQAGTPNTGLGHGYHNGEVKISTSRDTNGDHVLVDPERGGLQVRNLANDYYQGWDRGRPSSDADNVWGNGSKDDRRTTDVDAYVAATQTWDYFLKQHGRRGIHDDGVGPRLFTDVGPPDGEFFAQYDPECGCMVLGPAVGGNAAWNTTDVVAHEMTHGITGMTAGLNLNGESGGLNESTSDIFGTLVEFSANNGKDRPDYTIGEGVSGKPLRYMDDPTKDGASKGCWSPGVGEGEEPNHHIAGISNKFFYQLAVGSGKSQWGDSPTCGGAPAVKGIGNDKAGKIWYRALTRYLMPNSNFSGARAATLRAAADLYGKNSTEAKSVTAAWLAAGVDGSDPVPPAPLAPSLKWVNFQNSVVGAEILVRLVAPDPQRQRVTFTATGLPPGLTLNAATGVVTGRPTRQGSSEVTFTAADCDGNTSKRQISWEVAPG